MATIKGLITNEGLSSAQALSSLQGWNLIPVSFRVASTKGSFSATRDINSLETTFFDALVSGRVIESESVITLKCNIPAGSVASTTEIQEIYVISKDDLNNDKLFALYQVDDTITLAAHPDAEIELRLQLQVSNLDIGNQFTFEFSEAQTVDNHNSDPQAHMDAPPEDHLTQVGSKYSYATGNLIPGVNASLNEVYDETIFRKFFKATPKNPYSTVINFGASKLDMADGSKAILSNGSITIDFSGSDIDFSNGEIDSVPSFTPIDFSGQASKWAKYSVNLLSDGTVSVLKSSNFGNTADDVDNPALSGIKSVIIAVQDDGSAGVGTIENITEINIVRIPTSSGSGSGGEIGSGLVFGESFAPIKDLDSVTSQEVYFFSKADAGNQKLTSSIKIPSNYLGAQIGLYIDIYSPGNVSDTMVLQANSYLIRDEIDGLDSVANSYASSVTPITISVAYGVKRIFIPLSDSNGQINSLDINANDFIKFELFRGVDTTNEDIRMIISSVSVKLNF